MSAVQYWELLVDKTELKCSFTVSIDAQCVVVSPKYSSMLLQAVIHVR